MRCTRVCFCELRLSSHKLLVERARWLKVKVPYTQRTCTLCNNDNDNDNELFIQTKSNEKHHKSNINNTYKSTNITTFVPKRLHLKTSWPLTYN